MRGDMTETPRVDLLFQYALARAARADDYRWRQLGPIHLVKYAYLADLAHAARNNGDTYTGVRWRFYHFGPWSADAHDRIEPALVAGAGADERRFSSHYKDDHVRYYFDAQRAGQIENALATELPLRVAGAVARAVTAHGADTASLLRDVYVTPPMLAAHPGEVLDFAAAVPADEPTPDPRPRIRLTKAERRRRAKVLEDGRRRIRKMIAEPRSSRVVPSGPPPLYDEVFFRGTEALDRQAGEPPKPMRGTVTFDDSVWSSSQRRDPELP
jgi:hypothetical protein